MTNHQPHRRRARALGLAAFSLAALVPSSAGALAVDLGPVVDRAVDAVEPVRDTIAPVTDVIDETVRDTVEPVRDAVAPVTDVIDQPFRDTVEPVRDAVDRVTDTVPDPGLDAPPVINDPRAPTGSGIAANADRGGAPAGSTDGGTGAAPTDAGATGASGAVGVPLPPGLSVAGSGLSGLDSDRSLAQRPGESALAAAGRVLRDAAKAFRFPLLVGAAVLLFLAVQSRLDRRDPKLADPGDDEVLTFA